MPFLHLPIQSGSNKILKSMNRKHTREKYLSIIQSIKSVNSKIKFSSDFIVGYPGEDENDFFDTISLIKEVNFINSFSFIYSQRPGTPAANLQLVEREIQKKRLNILQSLLEDIQREKNLNDVGKSKEVLVENRLKDQKKYFGRSQDLTPVIFDCASDNDIGEIVNVKIKSSNQNSLFGVKQNLKSEVAA
jgi:tRNA-2-methylthio-N6-dimethylallyladenosine synthase